MGEFTIAEIGEHIGRELGVSDWVTIDQSRIDDFADCTGDHQWIHVDVERAKRESPFRGPIAHGYLMLSMVAPLSMEIGIIPKDAAAGLNYGIDKVRFLAPVPAGARVRLRVVIIGVEPREGGQAIMKTQNTLEVEGSQKPALIAETLAFLIPAKKTRRNNERGTSSPTLQQRTICRTRLRATLWRSIRWWACAARICSTAPAFLSKRWSTSRGLLSRSGSRFSVSSPISSAANPSARRSRAISASADPTWTNSMLHNRLLKAYLAWGAAVENFVTHSSLSAVDKQRASLLTTILIDAFAPTNSLIANPAAMRKLLDTGGESLLKGLKNYVEDLLKNGGLPSQVDTSAFKVGQNLATTPGSVMFRNELIELIQYAPTTPTVRQRPLVITPPQINKYYALDLSPDKSLVRFLLDGGIQTFAVSWRNPTVEHRDWGLDTYIAALDQAVDAVRDIAGADDISMMGSCSGGITSVAYLAVYGAAKEQKIKNLVLAVCHARYGRGRG